MSKSIKVDPDPLKRLDELNENFGKMFYVDPEGVEGIRTFAEVTPEKIRTVTVQDATNILQDVAEMRKYADENWNASSEWKHVARIPLALYLEWQRLGITQDSKTFLACIRKYKQFMTTNRRI